MTTYAVQSNAMLDTNMRLSDLQFSQIMGALEIRMWEPNTMYEHHHALRRQRLRNGSGAAISNDFWRSAKIRHWSTAPESTLAIVSSNFETRFVMRDLCVDIVEQLQQMSTPYVLAMKIPHAPGVPTTLSTNELLRYVVKQAVSLAKRYQSEKSMALSCAKFHDATTGIDWFRLLSSVLEVFHDSVYIIIDLNILERSASHLQTFSWTSAFTSYFADLVARGSSARIKVLFVSYGVVPFPLSAEEHKRFVVPARSETTTARQRKAGRGLYSETLRFRL